MPVHRLRSSSSRHELHVTRPSYPTCGRPWSRAVVVRRTLPEEMPDGPFDPIVASEILYYYTREEMLATSRDFELELAREAALLAVHWRRETKTYPLRGDEVHELLLGRTRLHNSKTIVESDYRLNLFEDPA
jgi:hypothetical protein